MRPRTRRTLHSGIHLCYRRMRVRQIGVGTMFKAIVHYVDNERWVEDCETLSAATRYGQHQSERPVIRLVEIVWDGHVIATFVDGDER